MGRERRRLHHRSGIWSGRGHAIRLAEEGAHIIAVDVLEDYETDGYGMSTHSYSDPTVAESIQEQAAPVVRTTNALPVPWVEPVDISNAIVFPPSDEIRYVTGTELKIDAEHTIR